MEMQFKNEIKKLADIVVWADNGIEEMRMDLSSLTEEEFKNLDAVKDLEAVKKVVLESMERHAVYTNALNKDIADKAAKIDLLEKEIEGRKEGYVALKELMDTKYISIEEHNNVCKDHEDTIEDYEEEIKSLNDEVERRRNAYRKDSEFIVNIKKELEDWKERERTKSNMLRDANDKIAELEKELADCKVKIRHQKENLDGINKTLEIRTKENESLIAVKNNLEKEIEVHEHENERLSERVNELKKERDKHIIDRNATIMQLEKQVKYLEKELNETCTCKELDLKGHNRREMALVNELADKNDEIKKLEESIDYYKNQERIRTDQLRATESKVEELHGSINRLTLNCRAKNTEIARLTKEHSDIRHELAKRTAELEFNGEDDHGRAGFKKYIEWLIEEEERAVPERFKERLNKEITEIFTKEEETEVEVDKSKNYGPIPESVRSERRAAKVNDIPCGEDSIE